MVKLFTEETQQVPFTVIQRPSQPGVPSVFERGVHIDMDVVRQGSHYSPRNITHDLVSDAPHGVEGVISNSVSVGMNVTRQDANVVSGKPSRRLATRKLQPTSQSFSIRLSKLTTGNDVVMDSLICVAYKGQTFTSHAQPGPCTPSHSQSACRMTVSIQTMWI